MIYCGRSMGNCKVLSKVYYYEDKELKVGEEIQGPKASDARLLVGWRAGERPQMDEKNL